MATYLQLVNDVLARLRENSVASVSTNAYSQLIGKFVNDTKRAVEDAWKWDSLNTVITVTTVAGTNTYTVTGSGRRYNKDVVINDYTSKSPVANVAKQWIDDQEQLTTTTNGSPVYYAWAGTDGTDGKIKLWPTPDGIYSLKVNIWVPQADLSADTDVLTINAEPVIMGAYARAIAERGEDGGMASSEAYSLYRSIVADMIAIEAGMSIENDCWVPA